MKKHGKNNCYYCNTPLIDMTKDNPLKIDLNPEEEVLFCPKCKIYLLR